MLALFTSCIAVGMSGVLRRQKKRWGTFVRSGGRWEKDQCRAVETHAEVVFCGASYEKCEADYVRDTDTNVDMLDLAL